MKLNAMMFRKESCHETSVCEVEKIIRLTDAEYDQFSNNLLRDHDFIKENRELMHRTTDGSWHCLLVVGETRPDGILVESEGYSYARYTAFVTNARELLLFDRLPPDMREALEKAPKIADWIVSEQEKKRELRISLNNLGDKFEIDLSFSDASQEILAHELWQRPEIDNLDIYENGLHVKFAEQIQAPVESQLEPEMTGGM